MERYGECLLIFSALNLKGCNSSSKKYLDDHIDKLINNYNPLGIQTVFLVIYLNCEKKFFNQYGQEYCEHIKNYTSDQFTSYLKKEFVQEGQYLKCTEYEFKCNGIVITVYNIIVLLDETLNELCG